MSAITTRPAPKLMAALSIVGLVALTACDDSPETPGEHLDEVLENSDEAFDAIIDDINNG